MVSAAITQLGGRPVALNWGSSVLAADLHSGNRKEVARAEFEDPREVTVTFFPNVMLGGEHYDAQTEAELHVGSGAVAYVVPIEMSLRGFCVHITCKTISVRLFSQNSAAAQKTLPRQARWHVGIALGQTVQQPPRVDSVGPIGTSGNFGAISNNPGAPLAFFLAPWTTSVQVIPVKNSATYPLPDMTKVYIREVSSTGPADAGAQVQYDWPASLSVATPMPLHRWTNAIRFASTNTDQCFLHIIQHWRL